MTRKDYVLIAEALSRAMSVTLGELVNHDSYRRGTKEAAHMLASALERDNPRFDRERFLKAAGVQQ